MTASRLFVSGFAAIALAFLSTAVRAGSGGFYVPGHYHPLDNLWKLALTIAVVWIIVRLSRNPGPR